MTTSLPSSYTVLVTGASGALGKVVCASLLKKQREALALSPDAAWRVVATSRAPRDNTTLALDICNAAQVSSVINSVKPHLIVHLAATLSDNFKEAFAVNVEGARNLCIAILASGHPTRLLLAGSAAEYGVVQPDENPIAVDHSLKPASLYGMTKAWQSMLGLYYASCGVDVVIARIFNLDGPGVSDKLFVGRIQKQIAAMQSGEQKRLKVGPLGAIRDYTSLDSAAGQILAIAERGQSGAVYHVGSGDGISMRALLQTYLDLAGLDFSVVDEDGGNSNHTGYDVPAIFADMTETAALLGAQVNDLGKKTLC